MRDVATCYHFKLMLPIKTVRRDVEWNGGQGLFEFKPPTSQRSGTKISSDHMHQWKYAVWAWFTGHTCSLPECQIYQVRGRLIMLMLAFILTTNVKWRFGLDVCPSTQTAQLSGFLQIDCNTLHSVPEFMLCTKRGHAKKNIRSQTAANKTFSSQHSSGSFLLRAATSVTGTTTCDFTKHSTASLSDNKLHLNHSLYWGDDGHLKATIMMMKYLTEKCLSLLLLLLFINYVQVHSDTLH